MKQMIYKEYCFTPLNPNTVKAKKFISNYTNTDPDKKDIYDVYKKPSSEKVASFAHIKAKMNILNGKNMRITGAGTDIYSCAYMIEMDNASYLVYETPDYSYLIRRNNE